MNEQIEFVLKSLAAEINGEQGTFEGLGAVYSNLDRQGDVIEPGAFADDDGREVPILMAHKADAVLGVAKLAHTPEGVRVFGRLLLDTEAGREAWSRLKARAVAGLSAGFRLLVPPRVENGVRRILKGEIAEISLTPFPANPRALVHATKQGENPYAALDRAVRPDWNLWG
ncbi:MAG: HK97 family phage prohead protease [Bryobacteraceae bacterium]|nr:HK97 family phage prohead protease [Bryobacteraceae bacterium]